MPYSTSFYAGEILVTDAYQTLYTVPSGYVAVLRDVELVNLAASDEQAFLALGPGSSTVPFAALTLAASGGWGQWKGRVVMDVGVTLQLFVETEPTAAVISGYLLSSP